MQKIKRFAVSVACFVILSAFAGVTVAPPSPTLALDLIRKSEQHIRGKTLEARALMQIVRGSSTRTLEFLLWAKGSEHAAVKVLGPEKDRGSAHLRIGADLWQYTPSVERVQKIAPSMTKMAWMGADFTNGDLVRSTNLSRYYDHRIVSEEKRDGHNVYKIESQPKRDAPVESGKILTWLTKPDAVLVRQEYYNAENKLDRTLVGKNFRDVGGHRFPGTLIITRPGETSSFTQVDYRTTRFDQPIDDAIFTQEFLRKRIDTPPLSPP